MKKRIQFDLPESTIERLDALKHKVEASSYAEVFKNALRLYEWAVTECGDNPRLVIQKEDGTTQIVRIFT